MEPRGGRVAAQKGRAEIGHFIEPMACLAVADLSAGSDWEYELKLDGYRAIAFKTRGRVHLRSRNGKDFSQRFPSLGRALEPLAAETVVDGEIVVSWCRDFTERRDTMASGRFLFVSFDGRGNTAPTYPLVRRLVARGHKVTLLGQPAQAKAARALGATFAPLGLPDWTPGASIEEQEDVLLPLLFGPAVGEAVLESLDREAPAVLVVDCMLTSALAPAERSRLPAAALVHL